MGGRNSGQGAKRISFRTRDEAMAALQKTFKEGRAKLAEAAKRVADLNLLPVKKPT